MLKWNNTKISNGSSEIEPQIWITESLDEERCVDLFSFKSHGNIKYGDQKERGCTLSLEHWAIDRKAAWSGLTKNSKCCCYIVGPKPQLQDTTLHFVTFYVLLNGPPYASDKVQSFQYIFSFLTTPFPVQYSCWSHPSSELPVPPLPPTCPLATPVAFTIPSPQAQNICHKRNIDSSRQDIQCAWVLFEAITKFFEFLKYFN